ncbi:extracellular solute-binding protein [Noviherbaspirillum sp. CPCC 100848]|uniref:Extracellular solute-binding protein n=1 Tax=Noviherbaspirillum album TaxID=3080276 RepID=A0ABU6J2V9_9BURK|nr:extracellular solute-binding protein [Noviherbaspirillum sp. CPCC 100848]MEC4717976.1 extracellular solute-binding protein [Noviherbaspirillum sp. CPCC 100848]
MRIARLLAVLIWAMVFCTQAQAQTEVRLWTLLGGGDGARMRSLIREFNASQQDVRVVETVLKWGEPFYTKLITASVVGAGPDVASIHLSRIANLAGGGVLRAISADELAEAGLRSGDFYARQWHGAQYRDQTYAVPLDLHMLVLYYNKTLARRAGLLDANGGLRPVEGIAALTQAFRAVKEQTGEQGMTMESGPNSFAVWRLWLSMLAQRNTPLIDGAGFAYGKAGRESLAAISDWYASGYASSGLDYPASTSQFMSGKAGFMINGVWEVPEIAAARRSGTLGFEVGIMPFPRMYEDRSVWGDAHGFAIPANGDSPPSAEKVRAVMRFIAYVSKHSIAWAEGGHVPAYRPVAESAAARALMPNALYAGSVEHVIDEPAAWYAGAAGPLQSIASKYLPAALAGQLTPAQALDMFETEAARLLRKRAPQY